MGLREFIKELCSDISKFYRKNDYDSKEAELRRQGYKQHSVHKDIWYDAEKGEYYRNANGKIEKINPTFLPTKRF